MHNPAYFLSTPCTTSNTPLSSSSTLITSYSPAAGEKGNRFEFLTFQSLLLPFIIREQWLLEELIKNLSKWIIMLIIAWQVTILHRPSELKETKQENKTTANQLYKWPIPLMGDHRPDPVTSLNICKYSTSFYPLHVTVMLRGEYLTRQQGTQSDDKRSDDKRSDDKRSNKNITRFI